MGEGTKKFKLPVIKQISDEKVTYSTGKIINDTVLTL